MLIVLFLSVLKTFLMFRQFINPSQDIRRMPCSQNPNLICKVNAFFHIKIQFIIEKNSIKNYSCSKTAKSYAILYDFLKFLFQQRFKEISLKMRVRLKYDFLKQSVSNVKMTYVLYCLYLFLVFLRILLVNHKQNVYCCNFNLSIY